MTELQSLQVQVAKLDFLCEQKQDIIEEYQRFIARLKMQSPMAYNALTKDENM